MVASRKLSRFFKKEKAVEQAPLPYDTENGNEVLQLVKELSVAQHHVSLLRTQADANDGSTAALQRENSDLKSRLENLEDEYSQIQSQTPEKETQLYNLKSRLNAAENLAAILKFETSHYKASYESAVSKMGNSQSRVYSLEDCGIGVSPTISTHKDDDLGPNNPWRPTQEIVVTLPDSACDIDGLEEQKRRLERDIAQERKKLEQLRDFSRREIKILNEEVAHKKREMADQERAFEASQAASRKREDDLSREVELLRETQLSWKTLLGSKVTPRMLFTLLAHGEHTSSSETKTLSLRPAEPLKLWHLSHQDLDLSLCEEDIKTLIKDMCELRDRPGSSYVISHKTCVVCHVQKLCCKPDSNRLWSQVNEFPTEPIHNGACPASICRSCATKRLQVAVKSYWWTDLSSSRWLGCPEPNCHIMLDLENGDFIEILLKLQSPSFIEHARMYTLMSTLRSSLQNLDPTPDPEALLLALRLHKRLVERKVMLEFSDPKFGDEAIPDIGRIYQAQLDCYQTKIPIFEKFLIRNETPVDCLACAETFHEVSYRSEEEWQEICADFSGPWMWDVLTFPCKRTLQCDHQLDMCKTCIGRHLETQLETYGAARCDHLSCPECSRHLSREEIRYFAPQETFEKYERFCLQSHLSKLPNFRWCLRENCSNGQLYEETEHLDPQIMCEECAFEMCFIHQVVWHEGLTCQQYDNQREHGDRDYADTQDWVTRNAKACPGPNCGVTTQKDAGCFHMTCKVCNYEYCWECLADWKLINPEGGSYNRNAHRPGCWFLDQDTEPQEIAGNNLMEALRNR